MNWGAKKVVCCSRNMCASGKGIDALFCSLSFFLTLNAESPGLFARIETVFPCFPTASAVAVTTSFFFLFFSGTWSSGSQLLLEDSAEDQT